MKKLLFFTLFLPIIRFSQNTRIISGKICGLDEIEIQEVLVKVVNDTIKTKTDIFGFYSISVPKNADSLEFLFFGSKFKQVPIDKNVIDITFYNNKYDIDLRDVVVICVSPIGSPTEKSIKKSERIENRKKRKFKRQQKRLNRKNRLIN